MKADVLDTRRLIQFSVAWLASERTRALFIVIERASESPRVAFFFRRRRLGARHCAVPWSRAIVTPRYVRVEVHRGNHLNRPNCILVHFAAAAESRRRSEMTSPAPFDGPDGLNALLLC